MGEAKRRKAAKPEQAAMALMQDVGVPIPAGFPLDGNQDAVRSALVTAGHARMDLVEKVRTSLAQDPDGKVNAILGVIKHLAYGYADSINDHIIQASPLQIACRQGCAWCCHQNVEVSIGEAVLIAVEMSITGNKHGEVLDERAGELAGLDDVARAKTGRPCPLLDAEGSCSVYEVRPLACRSYVGPDAANCKAAFDSAVHGNGEVRPVSHGLPQITGCAVRAGVNGMLKDFGLQHDDVDLVSAVAAIRKDYAIIDRGPRGKARLSCGLPTRTGPRLRWVRRTELRPADPPTFVDLAAMDVLARSYRPPRSWVARTAGDAIDEPRKRRPITRIRHERQVLRTASHRRERSRTREVISKTSSTFS